MGDIIEITERIDADWLRGTTCGKSGIFPQVFVQIKVDTPIGIVGEGEGSGNMGGKKRSDDVNVAIAVFDYEGQEGDLSFKVRSYHTYLCMHLHVFWCKTICIHVHAWYTCIYTCISLAATGTFTM